MRARRITVMPHNVSLTIPLNIDPMEDTMRKRSTVIILTVLLLTGCGQEKQETNLVLYEKPASETVPGLTVIPDIEYTAEISVGPESKKVPLSITWTVAQDQSNCFRVADFKVARTGGEQTVVISDISHAAMDCGIKWDSPDTTRFEMILIKLKCNARTGLQSYSFEGVVISIHGNGESLARIQQ